MSDIVDYYISRAHGQEGPFPLLSIMRKIRMGQLTPDDWVSRSTAKDSPLRASDIDELKDFFRDKREIDALKSEARHSTIRFSTAVLDGWRFLTLNPMMAVAAGGVILAAFLVTLIFTKLLGIYAGIAIGFITLYVLQGLYCAVALRLNRGQYLTQQAIFEIYLPALPQLLMTSSLVGAITLMGLGAAVIPGVFILAVYAFIPFLIVDRGFTPVQAMNASRMQSIRRGAESFGVVFALMTMNVLAMILVFPLLITLPILASALADIYDQLSVGADG